MRFRVTAVPTGRPMAKATWGIAQEESGSIMHQITPLRTRVPSRRKRRKSCPRCSRSIKPRDGDGP
jgi:hypothetical protein